jgi:putative FmdB family regulatory protein
VPDPGAHALLEDHMPTYAYACTVCDHRFEAVQSFSDDALTVCPECDGRLRKVFGAVGVVFKGSGFYRTDSRSTSSAASGNGSSGNGSAAKEPAKASGGSTPSKSAKESSTSSTSSSSTSSSSAA